MMLLVDYGLIPYTFPFDPRVPFVPGMIASYDGKIITVSDGSSAFGVFDDAYSLTGLSTVVGNTVTVWVGRGTFYTDEYIIQAGLPRMIIGSLLYADRNGRLTSYYGNVCVGSCVGSFGNRIQVMWDLSSIPGGHSGRIVNSRRKKLA